MIYKKHIYTTALFMLLGSFTFAQTFMVFEKMGTKKRFVYYIGEEIEFQKVGHKSFERGILTAILDSEFVSYNDTIPFTSVNKINTKYKKESGILRAAGPVLITAGVVLLSIDLINRGLVQDGGYTWDSGIGVASAALVTTGALIILLRKDKIRIKENGWWRLRKVAIN